MKNKILFGMLVGLAVGMYIWLIFLCCGLLVEIGKVEALKEIVRTLPSSRHQIAFIGPVYSGPRTTTALAPVVAPEVKFEPTTSPEVADQTLNSFEMAIIDKINLQRWRIGLPDYKVNSKLIAAADTRAKDMIKFDYWSHDAPSEKTYMDFVYETGYRYSIVGENLARGFSLPEEIVDAFMQSPRHRDNILDTDFTEIGLRRIDNITVVYFAKPN